MTVFLYGPPASGKTTLGRELATRLGADFVDLDEEIVRTAGRSIPDIFAADGEAAFRARESAALAAVTARAATVSRTVVALGGGTLLDERNRALCEKTGLVACLEAPSAEERARRIAEMAGSRPLGDRAIERAAHYASFPNRIAAFFDAGDSLVVVGCGLASVVTRTQPLLADATVASLYAKDLLAEACVLGTIPSGEANKTPATVMALWHALGAGGLGRRDVVAALGGGVTGDLVGFAAATWMRGIDWINVPTTLLAMVDASTGGKTGCDLPEGKNLAGAFHPPRLVVIDTDFLKTLPPDVLAAGRAEMIKHEAIGGIAPAAGGLPTPGEIARNLMVKVGIVREDPFEKLGRRLLLNCGHTVAHAIEKATDYRLSHGEAVSVGCVEEARLAVRLGLAPATWPEELAARFAAAGLPTALPDGLTLAGLVPLMRGDKKRVGGSVVFALPCGWGDVRATRLDLSEGTLP